MIGYFTHQMKMQFNMKKLFIIILFFMSVISFGQTIECNPNRITTLGSPTLDTVAGDAAIVYFRFTAPVHYYSVQIYVKDTIEGVSSGARLEGTNYVQATAWNTVVTVPTVAGDTLIMTKDVANFATPRIWTGTTFPYAVGRVRIPDYSITEGSVTILVYYQ